MTKFKLDTRWAIVAVGFVALSLAFSGRSMLSLAMAEWTSEFGWTKSSISGIMTVTLVIMAGLAPLVGYAIDRSGRASSSPAACCWSVLARPCWRHGKQAGFHHRLRRARRARLRPGRHPRGQQRGRAQLRRGAGAGGRHRDLRLDGGAVRVHADPRPGAGGRGLAAGIRRSPARASSSLSSPGGCYATPVPPPQRAAPPQARRRASSRASATCCAGRRSTACSGAISCAGTHQRRGGDAPHSVRAILRHPAGAERARLRHPDGRQYIGHDRAGYLTDRMNRTRRRWPLSTSSARSPS